VPCRQRATYAQRWGAFLPINYEFQRFGRWYGAFEPGQVFGPHLFLQGIKIFADRAEDGLGYQTEPPDPAVQGRLFWEPDELAVEIGHAHKAGWQIAVHATGDGGLDAVLDGFEPIGRSGIVAARHRIEHVSMVRDDQVERIAELGLIARRSSTPGSTKARRTISFGGWEATGSLSPGAGETSSLPASP
jgi:hypothetical protein